MNEDDEEEEEVDDDVYDDNDDEDDYDEGNVKVFVGFIARYVTLYYKLQCGESAWHIKCDIY